jgi:hypothetical protein
VREYAEDRSQQLTLCAALMQDLEMAETRSLPFILLLMVLAFRGERF